MLETGSQVPTAPNRKGQSPLAVAREADVRAFLLSVSTCGSGDGDGGGGVPGCEGREC